MKGFYLYYGFIWHKMFSFWHYSIPPTCIGRVPRQYIEQKLAGNSVMRNELTTVIDGQGKASLYNTMTL